MTENTGSATLHNCARPGCDVGIGPTLFACLGHWRELPQDLRRTISAAWKARQAGSERALIDHRRAMAEAFGFWMGQS